MTFLITAKDVQSVLTYPLSLKTVEVGIQGFRSGQSLPATKVLLNIQKWRLAFDASLH